MQIKATMTRWRGEEWQTSRGSSTASSNRRGGEEGRQDGGEEDEEEVVCVAEEEEVVVLLLLPRREEEVVVEAVVEEGALPSRVLLSYKRISSASLVPRRSLSFCIMTAPSLSPPPSPLPATEAMLPSKDTSLPPSTPIISSSTLRCSLFPSLPRNPNPTNTLG